MTVYVIIESKPTWDWCDWQIVGVYRDHTEAQAQLNYLKLTTPEKEPADYSLEPWEVA